MKHIKYVVFLLLILSSSLQAQNRISPTTKISLITCGAGTELYSTFGHSAIWLNDASTGLDIVYNFGTFDFDTPNFYVKFTRGQLPYMLSTSSMTDFMNAYIYENRSVYEQELNLTLEQKEKMFALLEENMKPENRQYKYDFFFDNCSTRQRDLFEKTLNIAGGQKYTYQEIKGDTTLRVMLDPGVSKMQWTQFGFYLGLGSVTDKIATTHQRMFLPDKLMATYATARIGHGPAVLKTKTLFQAHNDVTKIESKNPLTPTLLFSFIFIVIAAFTYRDFKKGNAYTLIDKFLFLCLGLLGFFLAFLWFGTDHLATKNNMNLIWAFPIHAIVVFLFKNPKNQALLKNYMLFTFVFTSMLIATFNFFPQKFHIAVLPILLCIAMRSFICYKSKIS
jgi:hypothetical protein